MTDIFSKRKRSEVMSKVSQKDTPQEVLIRKFLFSKGFRFRKNVKSLPGTPDIVLSKHKIAIFVNGCFWHGHDCSKGRLPASNVDFWVSKIDSNKKRDQKKAETLKELGWNIIVIWQCDITNKKKIENCLSDLLANIAQNSAIK